MALSPRRRALVVLVATVLGAALTANLGAWQLRRAAQKNALAAMLATRAHEPPLADAALARDAAGVAAQRYRAVRLRGRWIAAHTVYLENRQMRGRVGFDVVTPLQLADRPEAVLVQRGWVPRDLRDRTLLPPLATADGVVDVVGRIAPPPARLYDFAGGSAGPIRQNIDPSRFAAETGLVLLPLSVEQSDTAATAGDGLLRDWPLPAVNVQQHYGYAFQWFALCALMSGLYVWFQIVRPRLRRGA